MTRTTSPGWYFFLVVLALCMACLPMAARAADTLSTVATPTFSPDGGVFSASSLLVTIHCATPGASIRYTVDGTPPSRSYGTLIVSGTAINIETSVKLQAIAYKSDMADSPVKSATYSRVSPDPAPYTFEDFTIDGDAVNGTHRGVNFGTGQWCYTVGYAGLSGCGYYSSDVTSRTFTLPAGKVLKSIRVGSDTAGSTWTVSDSASGNTQKSGTIATANTGVFINTGWQNASGTITVTSSNGWNTCWDDIVYGDPAKVATPTMSPTPPYTMFAPTEVALSCATSGAVIRYTLDGTTPTTNSMIYSAPIHLTSTTTVKAIAMRSGMQNSDIASGVYSAAPPKVATPVMTPPSGYLSNSTYQVSLSCATSGATIRYTLDGSNPNAASTIYAQPITITRYTTIKAMALKTGMTNSDIAVGTYSLYSLPRYETEQGTIGGGGVYDHANASNGQAVGWLDEVGDYSEVTMPITIPGNYRLYIRYVTDSDATWSIYVNGVHQGDVSFPARENWDDFGTANGPLIPLNVGNNTVRLQRDEDDGGGYVDTDYFSTQGPM